jgi:hypothetical protein
MASKREAWFERRRFGGMRPIHWKGFALMLATGGLFSLLIYAAIYLPERFNYAGMVRPACVSIAAAGLVSSLVLSLLRSRPWRERY